MKTSSALRLVAILLACLALPAASAHAATPPTVSKIATGGFGDRQNSYAWSMAWFKGKLYVGTARNQNCVENATVKFYYPNTNSYKAIPSEGISCTPDMYDLDLRAEIWQYTPSTNAWVRVYQSPVQANPRAPGKTVARDIGYRGMVVHTDPATGQEALYVGGVTADEYIPELAQSSPPRILRTTDGTTFNALGGAPGQINVACCGLQWPIGYRSMESYDGRLFVTASGGLTGDGVLLEVTNPGGKAGTTPTFKQVSPFGMQIFELEVFNGSLWVGTGQENVGYSVQRTKATGATPYAFTPIITKGGGRPRNMESVVSMHVYQNHLYVGASGWTGTTSQSELTRVNTDDTWDLVVGTAHLDSNLKYRRPLSGLGDGFGNAFAAHFWRQEDYNGELWVGTNDWSWSLRQVPGSKTLLANTFGFDIYGTCNGTSWYNVTPNAFGDGVYNFGARTMVTSNDSRYVGSANHAQGTSIWRQTGPGNCQTATTSTKPPGTSSTPGATPSAPTTAANTAGTTASTSAAPKRKAPRPLKPPRKLNGKLGKCGAALTWRGAGGAKKFTILRSTYRMADVPQPDVSPVLPNGFRFESGGGGILGPNTKRMSVPGPLRIIGRSTSTRFVDRHAKRGKQYIYGVQGRRGSRKSVATIITVRAKNPLQKATRRTSKLLRAACR